ncbi:MAG: hypothetical protein J6J24_01830 [Clostridia bacterium]|nr:hypothetical protein [Clostridia bacterium]
MKKLILIVLCVCFSFLCYGCESQTMVKSARISDITTALSTKHSVKVVLDKDERVTGKYVDVQLKSDKENQFLNFGEENQQGYTIFLPKKNYWYNLTYLISQTNGTKSEGNYQPYEEFGDRVYNFTSKNDFNLTFRVVVGQKKDNSSSGEEILVLSESVSDEVSIEVKSDKN